MTLTIQPPLGDMVKQGASGLHIRPAHPGWLALRIDGAIGLAKPTPEATGMRCRQLMTPQ